MKSILIAFLLLATVPCPAQKKLPAKKKKEKQTFEIGSTTVNAGSALSFATSPLPPLQAGVQKLASRRFSLGLQYGYYGLVEKDGLSGYAGQTFWTNRSTHVLLAGFEYYFINNRKFWMYSSVHAGARLAAVTTHYTDRYGLSQIYYQPTTFGFAFQAQLVGIKAKIMKNLGVYGDFGLGFLGIVRGGLQYTFDKKEK